MAAELQAERDALIAEIYAAFEGVSRVGGVSWNETNVIDHYGSAEQCRQARESDTDRDWMELRPNENWAAAAVLGTFSFLDPIGFRYYLPAAMLQTIQSSKDGCSNTGLDIVLTLNHKATKPSGIELRDYTLKQWSLLNERQRRCVARLIRHMIAWEKVAMEDEYPGYEADNWRKALDSYWSEF